MLEIFPEMLEYLAVTSCDDGAVVDVSFRDSQADSGKIEITSLSRKTVLKQRGWKGFSSNDL
jgi:hypothetical protein